MSTEGAPPNKPFRQPLVWILSAVLVVVLIAVGVLVWRSLDLSRQVSSLSDALTTTTVTTAAPTTTTTALPTTTVSSTTTTTDPWHGNWTSYNEQMMEYLAAREKLVDKSNNTSKYAKSQAKAINQDVIDLANRLNWFPAAPPDVTRAQDDYYNAVMQLSAACSVVMYNASSANVDTYNRAWAEELRLLNVWTREVSRSSTLRSFN
jgi:hypothetical protein